MIDVFLQFTFIFFFLIFLDDFIVSSQIENKKKIAQHSAIWEPGTRVARLNLLLGKFVFAAPQSLDTSS